MKWHFPRSRTVFDSARTILTLRTFLVQSLTIILTRYWIWTCPCRWKAAKWPFSLSSGPRIKMVARNSLWSLARYAANVCARAPGLLPVKWLSSSSCCPEILNWEDRQGKTVLRWPHMCLTGDVWAGLRTALLFLPARTFRDLRRGIPFQKIKLRAKNWERPHSLPDSLDLWEPEWKDTELFWTISHTTIIYYFNTPDILLRGKISHRNTRFNIAKAREMNFCVSQWSALLGLPWGPATASDRNKSTLWRFFATGLVQTRSVHDTPFCWDGDEQSRWDVGRLRPAVSPMSLAQTMASICWQKLMIKRADSARGAPADQLSRCVEPIARPNSRRSFSRRKSPGNCFSCCSLDPSDYCETVLESSRVFRFSSLHIARGDTTRSFPPSPSAASHRGSPSLHIDSAKDISRQPIAFHRTGDTAVYTAIQRVSHRGDQPSFLVADTHFVRCLVHR